MNILSRWSASIALAFTAATSAVLGQTEPQTPSEPKYGNFITTLKSLCKTHKYILLGDSDHGSLEIMELTSNKNVLQAIKDCGSTLVLEKGVEENQGYKPEKHPFDDKKTANEIRIIQSFLSSQGQKGIEQTGSWDIPTHHGFFAYIAQQQKRLKWKKDPAGIYSKEFADELKGQPKSSPARDKFLAALNYIDDIGLMPVAKTQKTIYEDIQRDPSAAMPPRPPKSDYIGYIEWLHLQEVFNAAKINLPLVYADPRHKKVAEDQEMDKAIQEVLYGSSDRSPVGVLATDLKMDAYFNKHPEKRPIYIRMNNFVEESLSPQMNKQIVDNGLAFAKTPSVVFKYGFAHMSEANDMDEMLGSGQAVTIFLKPREDQINWLSHPKASGFRVTHSDLPQYVYEIPTDKMIKIEAGTVTEQAYRSMDRYSFTKAEYDAALARLPKELKRFAFPHTEYDEDWSNNKVPENWQETKNIYTFK